MNYNKLTKAQLIERINELETQSIQYKVDNFVLESQLFLEDMIHVIKFLFNKGASARRSFQESPIPVYIDDLRTSLTTIYEARTQSFSKSKADEVVLLSQET